MKAKYRTTNGKEGVALVIVLGLLSVLTILAVAFAVSMRVERLAARNAAHAVRAEHLTQVALVRAVTEINKDVAGSVYPEWAALGSTGSDNAPSLLTGEAKRAIPTALYEGDAASEGSMQAQWIDIESTPGSETVMHGRIAYLALNASGLIDPNYAGGEKDEERGYTNVCDMDIAGMPDVDNDGNFFDEREERVRSETVAEMGAHPGLQSPIGHFYPYSLDIDRDQYFDPEDLAALGTEDAPDVLKPKFYLNSITNYDCYNDDPDLGKYEADGRFMSEFWNPLRQLLAEAGMERPDDVAWNFVNWLDEDRVPQSKDGDPWAHTEGGEGIPLFNEIVLTDQGGMLGAFKYKYEVELWFPFSPTKVEQSDDLYVQLAAWDMPHPQTGPPSYSRNAKNILEDGMKPTAELEEQIEYMEYETDSEFLTFEFDVEMTEPMSETNCLWFMGRVVVKRGGDVIPIEQASGPSGKWRPGNGGDWVNDRQYYPQAFYQTGIWTVDDPRSNGKRGDWQSEDTETLGAINGRCDPWSISPGNWRCGIPIYVKDGPMHTIGEVGYIYRSNVVPGQPGRWDTINLMHADKGAYLLDRMTVRDPKAPNAAKGLININSQHREVLTALFYHMLVGYTAKNPDKPKQEKRLPLPEENAGRIADKLIERSSKEPFISFRDVFREVGGTALQEGGPIALECRNAGVAAIPGGDGRVPSDKFLEDPFRQIADMISFRHNLFNIICVAQVYAPEKNEDGQYEIVAEKRALATVYRDSYTGHTFTRSFKWLSDE